MTGKKLAMKKLLYIVLAILTLVFASCNTKFDLYLDEGEKTVVYAVLDVDADTNFFKITKSSLNGEYYYNESDIDVFFTGRFQDGIGIDTVQLGSINKEYFTTKKLREGEEYELFIIRKADGVKVSGKTKTICHIEFKQPQPSNKYINFRSNILRKVEWTGSELAANNIINAKHFSVAGYFHYRELMPGAQDTVERCFEWFLGGGDDVELFNTTEFYYFMGYTPSRFFFELETDEYLVNNSPYGVQRWLEDFEFRIYSIGEELFYYNVATGSGNHYPEIPNYSNIENGVGVISACSTNSAFHTIEQLCRIRISQDYPYGFYYDPNR